MYKISVPVKNRPAGREMDREAVLAALRRVGAQRTFLCVCRSVADADERAAEIESLRRNRPFFEAAGLEVGVWMSALGHGGPLVSAGCPPRLVAHAIAAPHRPMRRSQLTGAWLAPVCSRRRSR